MGVSVEALGDPHSTHIPSFANFPPKHSRSAWTLSPPLPSATGAQSGAQRPAKPLQWQNDVERALKCEEGALKCEEGAIKCEDVAIKSQEGAVRQQGAVLPGTCPTSAPPSALGSVTAEPTARETSVKQSQNHRIKL